jgi:hypothetical protein
VVHHASALALYCNMSETPTRTRRQFPATYKLQILAAADACTKPAELGAIFESSTNRSSPAVSVTASCARRDRTPAIPSVFGALLPPSLQAATTHTANSTADCRH